MDDATAYAAQRRGDGGAYDRYLAGMDASMKQKVALTAAHLLCEGRVADMGMGSGSGSAALASLYPALSVTGVDVNPEMVARARERHAALENLDFREGDIAAPCFEPGSLDGVFDSSVLHHVTSFSGYDHEAAARALAVQAGQLRPDGVLIVRDFLDPGPGEVWLDVPADDGDDASDDPEACSTAALLRRFAREFRALHPEPGFPLAEVAPGPADPPLREGWRRFGLSRRLAVEFVLRKDYRADWATEVLEEYTYFTQERFEAVFAALGLRVLASTPIRNPWIVRNRYRGRFELRGRDGTPLEDPATNYVIAGERAPPGEGVRLRAGREREPLGFLERSCWRRRDTGQVFDLVRRPHLTVDVLPWFEAAGDVFVLARKSYPRPILTVPRRGGGSLDGSRAAGYATEPLAVLQGDRPLGQTVEEALRERAGLGGERLRGFREGARYYPSPGGVQEEVRAVHVEVDSVFVQRAVPDTSGFSTSGTVRAIEARQLLRAAQVGGLPNARLELNVYDLLRRLGGGFGAWIGEAIALPEGPAPRRRAALAELRARPARRRFAPADVASSPGFLELRCAEFEELDAAGEVVARRALEFVLPAGLSRSSVATALLRRHAGEVWIGLDDDDLPAAQCFSGNSQLLVAPAWRLPRDVASITPARAWIRARLRAEYGLETGEAWELGGRYHPSPGVTPEVVHPLALEVTAEGDGPRALVWVRLAEVAAGLAGLPDGHLRTVAARAAHALGL